MKPCGRRCVASDTAVLYLWEDHRHVVGIEFRYCPEGVVGEAIEKVGGQDSTTLNPLHLPAHLVQVRGAEGQVEIIGFVFDIIEIMCKPRLVQKIVKHVTGFP